MLEKKVGMTFGAGNQSFRWERAGEEDLRDLLLVSAQQRRDLHLPDVLRGRTPGPRGHGFEPTKRLGRGQEVMWSRYKACDGIGNWDPGDCSRQGCCNNRDCAATVGVAKGTRGSLSTAVRHPWKEP